MNFLNSLTGDRFSNGAAKVRIIFKLPNFSETFFKIPCGRTKCDSISMNLSLSASPLSQTGVQRYDFFVYFQIYFEKFSLSLI